jgi:hypothetical protein
MDFGGSRASDRPDANIASTFNEGSAGGLRSISAQCRGPSASPASGDPPVEPGDQPESDSANRPTLEQPATGFFIDPSAQSITPWAYNGDWRTIRTAIRTGGSPFTLVYLENGDCLFVDDEGLLKPLDWFFAVKGLHQPLAGCGLVLGADRDGETVSARTTLDDLKRRVLHLRIVATNPVRFLAWNAADLEMRAMTLAEVDAWMQNLPPPPPIPSRMIH